MDRSATPRPTTDELLAQVPLFAGLSKKDLAHISVLATRLDVPEGKELTRQGAPGREFIVILEGDVEVIIDGRPLKTLHAGDFVGEMALLESRPRTATVVAKTPASVDVIGRSEFAALIADHPAIAQQLLATMAEHLAEDEALKG
jgi:CRP-like cAMP-binding protein